MEYMEDSLQQTLGAVLPRIQKRILTRTTYFGIQTWKSPSDFWVYKEIIYNSRPDVIIEIGNNCGGSALALAHYLDAMDHGRIIAIDIDQSKIPDRVSDHPRISLIEGDACESYDRVVETVSPEDRVLVIEDSSHTFENTLNVLRRYSGLTKPGDYFIVEDSICHHGLSLGPNPGPYEAIEAFIAENDDFDIDRDQESFLITWNPKGYLRRKE